MSLSALLNADSEARSLYQSLPKAVQKELAHIGDSVTSLAGLREYANNIISHSSIHYNGLIGANNGIPLDPTLSAEWVMEHNS